MSEDKLPESEQKKWVQFDEEGGRGAAETPTDGNAPATIDVQNETSESPGDTSNIRVRSIVCRYFMSHRDFTDRHEPR